MKKAIKIVGGLVAAAIVAILCVVLFWLGPMIKKTVETVGPQALGAKVAVEKIRIKPLRGLVEIKGLHIGNPEGFANPSAVELKEFRVALNMGSLFTDTIIVKEILIAGPQFTYERKLTTDNIKELQKNVAAYTGSPADAPAEPAKEEAPAPSAKKKAGKRVIIERLAVLDGKVLAKISALPTAPIPLPDIEKTDIGKQKGGTSYADAAGEIISAIYGAIVEAVASLGNIAGDTLKDAGGTAKDAGEAVLNTATDAVKGIGGLFKKKE